MKSVTADIGTPTMTPSIRKTGARRTSGDHATARHMPDIAAKPTVIVRA
jgi:hypothetical protein